MSGEITALPDAHDLIWLFEAEPSLLDPDVPLPYNTITFITTRGDDRVECIISPAYRDLDLTWWRNDREIVRLSVTRVAEITVEREHGRELLQATLSGNSFLPLRLQLKPTIHLAWGMDLSAEG